MSMPDPNLPPEQQLEMLNGSGPLVQTGGAQAPPAGNAALAQTAQQKEAESKKKPEVSANAAIQAQIQKKVSEAGMQKDFSMLSIISKATADTKFESQASRARLSIVMQPGFSHGVFQKKEEQKNEID